jgi:hypothetical protein
MVGDPELCCPIALALRSNREHIGQTLRLLCLRVWFGMNEPRACHIIGLVQTERQCHGLGWTIASHPDAAPWETRDGRSAVGRLSESRRFGTKGTLDPMPPSTSTGGCDVATLGGVRKYVAVLGSDSEPQASGLRSSHHGASPRKLGQSLSDGAVSSSP